MSENIELFLHFTEQEALGKDIYRLFYETYNTHLPDLSTMEDVQVIPLIHRITGEELRFEFSICHDEEYTTLEIFPIDNVDHYIQMMNHLNLLITKLGKARGLSELYTLIVDEVHKLTEFDRVMICRF